MNYAIQNQWEKLTGSTQNKLAEEIDELCNKGLSVIKIAGKLNLRISLVWKYLQTKNPTVLKAAAW
jgi:hypothetical protein